MKELFVVSTLYQCISLASAIDAGRIPDRGAERILVLTNSALIPEITVPFHEAPGFAEAAARFDRTVDLSELLWPRRPGQFNPRAEELDLWERLLRAEWNLGDAAVSLFVESIQVNPAVALCRIFADAGISVHSDGLMSYGPTRNPLPRELAQRLETLVYVDLVPGLVPRLLREHNPALVPVDRADLRRGMEALARTLPEDDAVAAAISGTPAAELEKHSADHGASGSALILGQYLSELGILSAEEEVELHRNMLQKALDRGIRHCVFKPHPSAGPGAVTSIQAAAAELGLELEVLTSSSPAEVVMQRLKPDLVVSCFSTALMTAKHLFGIDAAAVGTEILLERLTPYQNSNRIPVTIIDALLERGYAAPAEAAAEEAAEAAGFEATRTLDASPERSAPLQQLVEAVSYCMQPQTLELARPAAEAFLADAQHTGDLRYFKRRRLTKLELPGSLPAAKVLHPLGRARRAGARQVKRVLTALAK
ncbi:alpha-2,8-polysialyltransferase family protein [Arthrobacter sp. Marseille-P9274]|uniref:alpha-2,8-polysialyltransferase family protein n=1 Tax=Arthrobacter sp. Marseille-P9274 TaxID=2866572 RepID=UPI0021CADAA4|nr:alpha-2,8-polysialyltransferase family protein [Arthrobacter sp. Marseille-P9274]